MSAPEYHTLDDDLLSLLDKNAQRLYHEYWGIMQIAPGSTGNHQGWRGGYVDHLMEVMNIAIQLYECLSGLRQLPFTLSDALNVLFLHDLEKPWKHAQIGPLMKTKEDRRHFRDEMIRSYGINLNPEQWNALRYVEGEYDDYSPGERKMHELAAFCHMCDIASARLWHDKGKEHAW